MSSAKGKGKSNPGREDSAEEDLAAGGLVDRELKQAYTSMLHLKSFLTQDSDGPLTEDLHEELNSALLYLKSKLQRPEVTYDSSYEKHLNIKLVDILILKPSISALRIEKTAFLGSDELWSSTNLYRHLYVLALLVPRRVCYDLSIFCASHALSD
jgi:hypothetical protein